MAADLTTTSTHSRPVSLSSASSEYAQESLYGRCDQARLVDALRTLLGVFYVPNETEAERARQIALFVQVLAEMSDDCVWWAMREWTRTQDRRPSPASLRQLGMMRRQEALAALPKPAPEPPPYRPATPEQLETRKAILARVAAEAGMVRNKHGEWTLPSELVETPRIPHWSETAGPDDPRWATLRRARAANAPAELW
jgi:hypothetical protein